MKNQNKSNEQLLNEIELLNSKITQLEEENKQFKIITENTSDNIAMTTFDLKAKYLYVSPSIKTTLDYEPEDLLGKSFFDFIHPDDKKALLPLLKNYIGRKVKNLFNKDNLPISEAIEFRFRNKAGEWRNMQSTVNIAGKNLLAVNRDVTDRKQAEKQLKKNQNLLTEVETMAKVGGWEMDLINNSANWTHGTYDIIEIGYDDPVPGPDEHLNYYLPAYREMVSNKMNALIEEGIELDFEALAKTAKGNIKWFKAHGRRIMRDGKCVKIYGTLQDIDKQKKIELALEVNEQRYRGLFENSTEFLFTLDLKGNFTDVNKAAVILTGFSKAELLQKNFKDYIPKADHRRLFLAFRKLYKTGELIHDLLIEANMKDNSKKYFLISLSPLRLGDQIIGSQGTSTDITKRMITEQALQETQIRLEKAQLLAKIGDYTWNVDSGEVSWSDGLFDLLKYDKREKIDYAKVNSDIHHPDDLKRVTQWLFECIDSGKDELTPNEYRLIRKDGEIIYVRTVGEINRKHDKTVVFATIQDITERKLIDEKVKKEKEYYVSFVSSIKDWVWEMDLDGIHTFSNPAVESILGYKVDEVVGQHVSKLWTEEDIKNNSKKILSKALVNNKGWKNSVGRFQHKNGTIVTTESSATPIFNSKNELIGFRGVDHDITERLQAEEIIVENARILRNSQRIAKIGGWSLDLVTDKAIWSNEVMEMYGRTIKDGTPNNDEWQKIIHQDDWSRLDSHLKEVKSGKSEYNIEYRIKRSDNGEIRYIHSLGEVVYENDIPSKLVGVDQDITELKKAEIEIRNQYTTYYTLLQNLNGMVYNCINDRKWTMNFISEGGFELTGYKPVDLLQNSKIAFNDLILPKFREKLWNLWQEKLKTNEAVEVEYQIKTATGKIKWVWERGRGIFDENGQLLHLEGYITDITERKLVEEELHKYRDHLEELVKERTAELEEKNKRLEDFNKLFVGREFRIKELRTKVKELEGKLGI